MLSADNDGNIRVLDANNGKELDLISIGKLAVPPSVVNKRVFFLKSDGLLLAYE